MGIISQVAYFGDILNISLARIEVTYFVGYHYNGNDKQTCIITCYVEGVNDENGGPFVARKRF